MDAVEYLKEKNRLIKGKCRVYSECCQCRLNLNNNGTGVSCIYFEERHPDKAVAIVEQWAKENPVKTYLSVLLEKFPMAPLDERGLPECFCPEELYGGEEWEGCHNGPKDKCMKCWNREYKEETNEN